MVPQSDPKATQMDMAEPFKTYGIYCTGATLGQLGRGWKSIFFLLAFLAPIFSGFSGFLSTLVPKWCPKWTTFFSGFGSELHLFLTRSLKVSTVGSRRAQRTKTDSQMVSEGTKRGSKIEGFGCPTCFHVPFRCAPKRYV